MNYEIKMRNKTIEFDDIIDLNSDQLNTITEYAINLTDKEILSSESGVKITLEQYQQQIVLAHKNSLVQNKDEKALLGEGTITFTKHARSRISVRVCDLGSDEPPTLDSILLVARLVIDSKVVDEKAEWKGRTNLVFTLIHEYINEKFKVSISFENKNNENIKVITVSNEHVAQLYNKVCDNPDIMAQLEEFKRKIITTRSHTLKS